MPEFTVSEAVDGDTFKVKMGGSGTTKHDPLRGYPTVRPTGYNTPEENERGYEEAKRRLSDLILNKRVDIKMPKRLTIMADW